MKPSDSRNPGSKGSLGLSEESGDQRNQSSLAGLGLRAYRVYGFGFIGFRV